MTFGDEIWDEEQWEIFLRKSDEQVRRYMDLLFGYLTDNPPPDASDRAARQAWEGRLRAFLRDKGFEHDPSLLDPLDDGEPPDDDAPEGAADDALEIPEARRRVRDIPVFQKAAALSSRVLAWSNALPVEVKDSALVHFCTSITQVPANIAKGHGIGYEHDMLGGNIACAKRGLAAANTALDQLRELREASYMTAPFYRQLYEQTYEVRNALALYVQELRARFNLGID